MHIVIQSSDSVTHDLDVSLKQRFFGFFLDVEREAVTRLHHLTDCYNHSLSTLKISKINKTACVFFIAKCIKLPETVKTAHLIPHECTTRIHPIFFIYIHFCSIEGDLNKSNAK